MAPAGAGAPSVGLRRCDALQLELRPGVGLAGDGLAVASGFVHLLDDDLIAFEPGVGGRCVCRCWEISG